MRVRCWGGKDSPEEGVATHCSALAWRIPWTEEPSDPAALHGGTKGLTRLKRLTVPKAQPALFSGALYFNVFFPSFKLQA